MILPKKRLFCILLIPLSMLLTRLAHASPAATERWFSMGVYRIFTETYGRVFGYLPFSVAQFLIILLPVCGLLYVSYEIYLIARPRKWFDDQKPRKIYAIRLVANIACVAGIYWIMFTLLTGLNYARIEFGETIGLDTRPSYVSELAALTEILVAHANELSPQVTRNEYGHMIVSAASMTALSRDARDIFRAAGDQWSVLRGYTPRAKPILYSRLFSHMRITGVFVPWTMEAHVNVDVPHFHIPATMLHELAHFRGIMREDEANFIAWLVGYHSGNVCFMYSGTMLALSYAAGQLSRHDRAEHTRIMGNLCYYVQLDRRANWEYWQQFEGPLAEISQAANDAYLRAQRQQDGVLSYGRVVDLLLAYFRN